MKQKHLFNDHHKKSVKNNLKAKKKKQRKKKPFGMSLLIGSGPVTDPVIDWL